MAAVGTRITNAVQRSRQRIEFGDFQTPVELARDVCNVLAARRPRSILEPTCGVGTFLVAALDQFQDATQALGVDINPQYARQARSAIRLQRLENSRKNDQRGQIRCGDFFQIDWTRILGELTEPILVIGNPPWVTNSELGSLESGNLPVRSNFQQHRGIDARTGRSNFDISEYMLLHLMERLVARRATLAMLCKTAVARRVLTHAWKMGWQLNRSELRRINAAAHFGAAVDACLLVCDFPGSTRSVECEIYPELHSTMISGTLGWRDGRLVADVGAYQRTKHLLAERTNSFWRSGIKHDCAAIMELRLECGRYRNGLGEDVDLEPDCVFPMLKSSEVTEQRRDTSNRYMIVPQRSVSDDTRLLAQSAPKTWNYLESHADLLRRRASSVYRNRHPYAIFGVGEYSFAPWKVAVPGLYKNPRFVAVGPRCGKPVVVDDTAYFLPCDGEAQARRFATLLNSDVAREFFSAFLFRDAKRPFTAELLRRLDLSRLAETPFPASRSRTTRRMPK